MRNVYDPSLTLMLVKGEGEIVEAEIITRILL